MTSERRDHELADIRALPEHLAGLHLASQVGDLVDVDLPDHPLLPDIIEGAGFVKARRYQGRQRLRRVRSLPDRVGPDMRLLIVGLNPSPASADSGIGFHRPGNRFWPAMLQSGLATVDRDPAHLLRAQRVGMTDIVKRTTRRADEVTADEFRRGMQRLHRLAEWLVPEALCFVGLQGWRVAVDRHAGRGWQDARIGGRPAYVMPSTSGLNAHDTVDSLAEHLRRAAACRPAR